MNWFLNRLDGARPETTHRARLVVLFSLGTGAVAMLFSPISYMFSGASPAIFVAIVAPLIASSAFVVRWTGGWQFATQLYLLSVWLLFSGFALLLGGWTTPSFPAYSVLILGATFLGGRGSGVAWTVISIVTILILWKARGKWIPMAEISQEDLDLLLVLAVLAILSLVCFFALQYDRAKNTALAELRDSNLRTAQMITQLEQASQRLVFSSEKLLGSSDWADAGLVGQMMQKARDGRTAIEKSRTSMSGMIAQYRNITERVQTLYEHSRVIVDIVDTIDRISDRLDLMALNVGIEAAHGGDGNKQFSILASDMRLLAERVVNETRQIKRALRRVHEQVRDVLESSLSGQELTEESAETVSHMAAAFDDIYTLIEEAEGATGQVTNDTLLQINAVRKLVTAASATPRA